MSDQGDSTGQCVFCGIVAGTLPCAKVAEDAATFAFMDIDPGSDGHLLVVPKRHSADLVEISGDDLVATTLAAQRIAKVALRELGADGVNLLNCCGAAAWQTVFHFHLHVIPRYRDKGKDRLELPFEPGKPADPDAIAERARVLAAALQSATRPAVDDLIARARSRVEATGVRVDAESILAARDADRR